MTARRTSGFGRTMGQDQAGRAPLNPPGTPRITQEQVRAEARRLGFIIQRRPGAQCWWIKFPREWLTSGATNYLAIEHMRRLAAERRHD